MRYFLFLLILCGVLLAYGQNTCTQRLKLAEDDYEAGRLLDIPGRLSECLAQNGFTKEERIRARKLLALVYIFTDQEREAEQAMINLLKADKEHRLNPQVDPAEIYYLYNQFRVNPIFRVGFRLGANSSYVNVIRERTTSPVPLPKFYNGKTSTGLTSYQLNESENQQSEEEGMYTAEPGIGLGYWAEILLERHIKKGLEVALGAQYRISSYNVIGYVSESMKMSRTNSQTYLRFPLLLKYNIWYNQRDRKIIPYVFAGGSYDILLTASYTSANRVGGTSYTDQESDLLATNQVNDKAFSLTGGIGAKLRVATHFFTAEVRYDNSLKAYTNGNAYADQTTHFDGAFVEDDLSLNFLSISLGFTTSIYNPKKIK